MFLEGTDGLQFLVSVMTPALLERLLLELLAALPDLLRPTKVHIGWAQIAQRFVVALMVVLDFTIQTSWERSRYGVG